MSPFLANITRINEFVFIKKRTDGAVQATIHEGRSCQKT